MDWGSSRNSPTRDHTAKPTKVTCTGPTTFAAGTTITAGYRDQKELAWDFVGIVNQELKALVEAGAGFIQVDEPAFSDIHQDGRELAAIFNAAVEGVNAKLAMHICFGNHHGRPLVKRTFRKLFPGFLDAKADQYVLEFANREMAEIEMWKDVGSRKELGAGLIDQKSFYVETPEDVAGRIRIALKYVPAEKLWTQSRLWWLQSDAALGRPFPSSRRWSRGRKSSAESWGRDVSTERHWDYGVMMANIDMTRRYSILLPSELDGPARAKDKTIIVCRQEVPYEEISHRAPRASTGMGR
jgi:Cobalamin-independent synthase, Catalytic domain